MDYGPAFKGTYIFSISEIKVSLREPRSAESDTCVFATWWGLPEKYPPSSGFQNAASFLSFFILKKKMNMVLLERYFDSK